MGGDQLPDLHVWGSTNKLKGASTAAQLEKQENYGDGPDKSIAQPRHNDDDAWQLPTACIRSTE